MGNFVVAPKELDFKMHEDEQDFLKSLVSKVLKSDEWDSSCDLFLNKLCDITNLMKLRYLKNWVNFALFFGGELFFIKIIDVNYLAFLICFLCVLGLEKTICSIFLGNFRVSKRLTQSVEKEILDDWIHSLINKKAQLLSKDKTEEEQKCLEEEIIVLKNRKKVYKKGLILFGSIGLLGAMPLISGVLLGGILSIILILGFGVTSFKLIKSIININDTIKTYSELSESVGRTVTFSPASVKCNKKENNVKYSYKPDKMLNRGSREVYDYQAIKTRQGYTKKRTITGVKSFK